MTWFEQQFRTSLKGSRVGPEVEGEEGKEWKYHNEVNELTQHSKCQ